MKEVVIEVPEGMELKQEGNTWTLVEKKFRLEIGKDYKHVKHPFIVIDRRGENGNFGFLPRFNPTLYCYMEGNWIEASKLEVIEAFEKECKIRFGDDWEERKLKSSPMCTINNSGLNIGCYTPVISKDEGGWRVWNKNGVLYYKGVWAEPEEELTLDSFIKMMDEVIAQSLSELLEKYSHLLSEEEIKIIKGYYNDKV